MNSNPTGLTIDPSNVSDNFDPEAGQSFDILDWATRSGMFATLNLPELSSNLMWDTSELYTTGALQVCVNGDYNHNGVVDGADYVLWRKNDGTQAGYNQWRENFGETVGSGSGAAANATVPESATAVLLMFAAAGCYLRRGRHT